MKKLIIALSAQAVILLLAYTWHILFTEGEQLEMKIRQEVYH